MTLGWWACDCCGSSVEVDHAEGCCRCGTFWDEDATEKRTTSD